MASQQPENIARKLHVVPGGRTPRWEMDFVLEGQDCPHYQTITGAFFGVRTPNNSDPRWFYHEIPNTGFPAAILISSMEHRGGGKKESHFYIRGKIGSEPTALYVEKDKRLPEMSFKGYWWPNSQRFEIRATSHDLDSTSLLNLMFYADFIPHKGFSSYKGNGVYVS